MTDTTTISGDSGAAPKGIALSESAVEKLSGLIESEGSDKMLRIVVNGGGCSGFTYAFDLDDQVNDDDRTFETDGIKVVVDDASLEFIDGSVLNYVESLGGTHFQLENPNAASTCGCGSSFAVY